MRRVSNFDEVNDALRQLFALRDSLLVLNVDWHQRRIINAHPSVDDFDYVVRKELHDLVGGGKTAHPVRASSVVAANYDKITFGAGVGIPIIVGSNITPPYVWSNNRTGRPSIIFLCANVSPTGADLILDVKKNGASIFTLGSVHFPAGTGNRVVVSYSGVFTGTSFTRGDVITLDCTQTGSTLAGQDVQVTTFCTLT